MFCTAPKNYIWWFIAQNNEFCSCVRRPPIYARVILFVPIWQVGRRSVFLVWAEPYASRLPFILDPLVNLSLVARLASVSARDSTCASVYRVSARMRFAFIWGNPTLVIGTEKGGTKKRGYRCAIGVWKRGVKGTQERAKGTQKTCEWRRDSPNFARINVVAGAYLPLHARMVGGRQN